MEIKIDPVLTDIHKINKRNTSYLVYHFLFKALDQAITKYATGKVIDIGCGNKPYEKLFHGKITNYTGCDISQNKLNTVDIICNVTDIPLPTESFDTVFCTQVIEHVANHEQLLNESYRLLKPGGHLILSCPLYWPVHGEPHDFFRFTKFGLEYLLHKKGFSILEMISNGGAWATAGQAMVHGFEFSRSKSLRIRVMRFFFFRLRFISLINTFFEWADKKDFTDTNTMNYVVVAKKPIL
jgi:SAM-dependent methyltransferase